MAAWLQPPNSSLFDYKLGCAALQRTLFELYFGFFEIKPINVWR
jgi:hypothetical protein